MAYTGDGASLANLPTDANPAHWRRARRMQTVTFKAPCTAGLAPKRLNFAVLDDVQAKFGKHWLNDKLNRHAK